MNSKRKQYKVRPDYRPLLVRVKKLFPTMLKHVNLKRVLLIGMTTKKSKFIAEIRRNGPPWASVLPDYDFVITFWSNRFDDKPKSYKLYVVLHELMHTHPDSFNPKHKGYRKLVKHDVMEFYSLLSTYGLKRQKVKDIYKGENHLLKVKALKNIGETIR